MNTRTAQSFSWPKPETADFTKTPVKDWNSPQPLSAATHVGRRLLLASVPALAIIVGSAWVVSNFAIINVMQAALSASGFIFLALALDARSGKSIALALTGICLPLLALLSFHVLPEFAIVAAAIIAAWMAALIFNRA